MYMLDLNWDTLQTSEVKRICNLDNVIHEVMLYFQDKAHALVIRTSIKVQRIFMPLAREPHLKATVHLKLLLEEVEGYLYSS